MKLPFHERAYVPHEKLHEYLLSESHQVGKQKARFFRAIGFDRSNAAILERQLVNLAQTGEALMSGRNRFGIKYVVSGEIESIQSGLVRIDSVWFLENGSETPRLVTAYPA